MARPSARATTSTLAVSPKNSRRPSSPLSPFEHLESIAEQSVILDIEALRKLLATPQAAGFTLQFVVQTKDCVFSTKTVGGDRWTVVARGLSTPSTFDGETEDLGNGQYRVHVTVTRAGTYDVDIRLFKCIVSSLIANTISTRLVPPFPLHLTVVAGPISAPHTQLIFDGHKAHSFELATVAGRESYFLIRARDQFGNATSLAKDDESFAVACEDSELQVLRQDSYEEGVYRVTFITTKAGPFNVGVSLRNAKSGATHPINGSPLAVTVLPGVPCLEHCSVTPHTSYSAGELGTYEVSLQDAFHNPISQATLSLQAEGGPVEFRQVLNCSTAPQPEPTPGHYRVSFYTELCAEYQIHTVITGNAGVPYGTTFELPLVPLTPAPGPMTVENCFNGEGQFRGVAGQHGEIRVFKRDRFNNPILARDTPGASTAASSFVIKCDNPALTVEPAETLDGSAYSIAYYTEKAGTYILWLHLGEERLHGGPFSLVIEPAAPDLEKSFLEAPLAPALTSQAGLVTLWLRDQFGNETNSQAEGQAALVEVLSSQQEGSEPRRLTLPVTFADPIRLDAPSPEVVLTSNISPVGTHALSDILNNNDPAAPSAPAGAADSAG
eukprot:RCo036793